MITLDPTEQEEGWDSFVHVDEVTAVAAERDTLRALLDRVAAAMGCPDQLHTDLPDSVEALRLQRDRLQAAAQDALSLGLRP